MNADESGKVMETDPGWHYLEDMRARFAALKDLAEGALAQVPDKEFFTVRGDPEVDNSLAVIVKHLAGNLRSRWTDFLTSDGEKPDRHRDTEFVIAPADTRGDLMGGWEAGWQALFAALETLAPGDVVRVVRIRREPHTVIQALDRQLSHYGYHVGQIVQLARWHAGSAWKTLSVPRGGSASFNAEMRRRHADDSAGEASGDME